MQWHDDGDYLNVGDLTKCRLMSAMKIKNDLRTVHKNKI
jgi:hypothetical protein